MMTTLFPAWAGVILIKRGEMLVKELFPAWAGVILMMTCSLMMPLPFPRMGGGDPCHDESVNRAANYFK